MKQKVILITGASSGIGCQTAEDLAKAGHQVYAAARRTEKMQSLTASGVTPLHLDVTDENECREVIETVIRKEGHIDVLINNAGFGLYGAVEDVPMEDARRVFDVNILGMATMIKYAVPYMRQRHSGLIINISSIGGRVPTYLGAYYHGTKFAVEGFSAALRIELARQGIKVVVFEPGGIKTEFGAVASARLEEISRGGANESEAMITAKGIRNQYSGNMLSKPKVISKAMVKIVNSRCPRNRYLIGFMAKPIVAMHALMPTRLYNKMMLRANNW